MTPRVACVIPALDSAPTLPRVIAGLRAALPEAWVIGVDDGSRDDTGRVIGALADEAIVFPVNRGKGAALRAGLAAARRRGCEVAVTLDADGQHDPALAPRLVAALREADLVVGARRRAGTAMPLQRRLSNLLASAAIRVVAGCRLEDTQSGYRALRLSILDLVDAPGDRYEFETELLIGASRAGLRIASVPVPTIYGPARSHFAGLRDTALIARAIWRHRPWALA